MPLIVNKPTRKVKLYSRFTHLRGLQYVTIEKYEGENSFEFYIKHFRKGVPDFGFAWIEEHQYFRVYIHVAEKGREKVCAGFPIMRIGDELAVAQFLTFYQAILDNRTNVPVDKE